MDYITFFCLTAKVRAAQKAYFKAKDTKAANAKDLLLQSLKLEGLLDAEIQNLLKFWKSDELKASWNKYLNQPVKS